jgi:hypothetical protein
MPFGLWKKPWEKCLCSFELQEYGVDGGHGWASITEPTGSPINKAEAQEMFKPDKHFRVIARALEGDQAGRFIGVVWAHYEPAKGIVKKEAIKEKPPAKPKEVEDVIEEWAERVDKVLQPVEKIMDTMERIRGRFGGEAQPQPSQGEEGEGGSYQIPPPEFEGKLPAMMHPYVVHIIAEEIKGVLDYGATRLSQAFGVGLPPGQTSPEREEEEEVIPSLAKFKEKKAAEQPPEEEDTGDITIPAPKKAKPEEKPEEDLKDSNQPPILEEEEGEEVAPPPEEVVPSLEEKVEEKPEEELPALPKRRRKK